MTLVRYYCAATLDGYIAESDDTLDWLLNYEGEFEGADSDEGQGGYESFYAGIGAMVMGSVTSYARARAESLGMDARGGIAERADRLVAILVLSFLGDVLGLPVLYEATLWVLAVASTYTVVFRVLKVRRQALEAGPLPE